MDVKDTGLSQKAFLEISVKCSLNLARKQSSFSKSKLWCVYLLLQLLSCSMVFSTCTNNGEVELMECSKAVLSLDIRNIKVDILLREIRRPILVWNSGHLHPF